MSDKLDWNSCKCSNLVILTSSFCSEYNTTYEQHCSITTIYYNCNSIIMHKNCDNTCLKWSSPMMSFGNSSVKTGIIHQTEDTFTAAACYYPDI